MHQRRIDIVGGLIRALAIGAAGMLLFGCASTSYPPAPATAASADYNWIIGPGDNVNIVVWRNPELSMSVPVRPDGKIATPLVEDLPALGKDATTLARDIEKALAKYIRDPVVTVIVTSFVGPYSEQIRVVGEAAEAAVASLPAEDDAARRDDRRRWPHRFRRRQRRDASCAPSDGNKQYSVRLKDLIRRGDVSANVEMKPGDVLIIPQSWF